MVARLSTDSRDLIVLTPHPDDAEYGCWAWVTSAVARGHRATILLMCDPGETRVWEAKSAAEGIGATVITTFLKNPAEAPVRAPGRDPHDKDMLERVMAGETQG